MFDHYDKSIYGKCNLLQVLLMAKVLMGSVIMASVIMANCIDGKSIMANVTEPF